MTQGLYGALEEATGSEQANKEIAQMVVEQFSAQNTLTGVAQSVVDRIVRVHHDQYMQVQLKIPVFWLSCLIYYLMFTSQIKDPHHSVCCQRDDITLLLRNFNFKLTPPSASNTLRSFYGTYNLGAGGDYFTHGAKFDSPAASCATNIGNDTLTEISVTSSESSEQQPKSSKAQKVVLDSEGRIEPYVDFTSFYQAVEKAKKDGTVPSDAIY